MLDGKFPNRLHVEALGFRVNAVLNNVEPFTAHVDVRAMGEVTAMGEVKPHDRVARLQQRKKHREVRLCTTVGLNIGPCGIKQLLGSLNRQGFDGIDVLTTAVIPLGG